MNRQQVIDRSVGGNYDGICGHYRAIARFDAGGFAALYFGGVRLRVNASSIPDDGLRQRRQIFQGMKLRLSWESKGWTCVK